MERKYYIDNLRWLAILLLFPFHAAVYPWYMTFLFTIAGMSCKYALQKRTNKQFVAERTKKLLIPFFFYLYCFENLRSICITGLYIFFGWMGIITLLGIGQSKLNVHNRLSDYLTRASFPVYILHMPILVVVGFFILKLPVGVAGQFSLIVLISVIVTFLIYEIVKRVPVLRFFLGIAKQKL